MALKKSRFFAELDKIAKTGLHFWPQTPRRSISMKLRPPPRAPQMVIGHHFFQPR